MWIDKHRNELSVRHRNSVVPTMPWNTGTHCAILIILSYTIAVIFHETEYWESTDRRVLR